MGASVYKVEGSAAMGPLWLRATCPAGESYRVMSVMIRFNNAPTTSEFLTIALDANAGAIYDTLVYTVDPSAASLTYIVWYPDGWEWLLEGGDVCALTYANTDNNIVSAQITLKRVA